MESCYLHFKSNVAFNLFINGEYVDLCDKQKSLDIVLKSNKLSYLFCPINSDKSYLTECGNIEIHKNKPLCTSKNIEIVPYGNSHYDIVYMTKSIDILSKYNIIQQEKLDNINICIYNDNGGKVKIEFKEKVYLSRIDDNIVESNILKIANAIVIVAILENKKRFAVAFSESENKFLLEKVCSSVEIDGDKLKMLTDLHDINHQGLVEEYDLNNLTNNSYIVYLTKKKLVFKDKIVPYAFLSSIHAKNYSLSKSYLSDEYSNISEEQLYRYFGDFDKFYYNSYNTSDRINYIVKGDSYKSFDFNISNGKIVDIREVTLS